MASAYKSSLSQSASLDGAMANEILTLIDSNFSSVTESTVMMSDDAKVVGGDNFEMGIGSSWTQLAENAQNGGMRLEAGSSFYMPSMDVSTADLLKQSMAIVSTNANNFMNLAAGGNPNATLAEQGMKEDALTERVATILKGLKPLIIGAAAILCLWMIFKPAKGRR
jgi:hypothetical protein